MTTPEWLTAPMLGIGAGIGILAACWQQVSKFAGAVWTNLRSLLFVTIVFEDKAAYAASVYLVKRMKRVTIGEFIVKGWKEYVKPRRREQIIGLRSVPRQPSFWRLGWKFVLASRDWYMVRITYFRWNFDQVEFIKSIMDAGNDLPCGNRFRVERKQGTIGDKPKFELMSKNDGPGSTGSGCMDALGELHTDPHSCEVIGWKPEELGRDGSGHAVDALALSEAALAAFGDARQWAVEADWYMQRGIPWKMGWLLHGAPGTGKTAFASAVAKDLGIPLFLVDLSSMTNNDLAKAWSAIVISAPCMAVFEDIHAVFAKSAKIANTGMEAGVTFECFLNTLDGVVPSDGVLTVITTNDINTIDPALGGLTDGGKPALRPGRIDRVLEFGPLDRSGMEKIARKVFVGHADAIWLDLVNNSSGVTGAVFQDICVKRALAFKRGISSAHTDS